MWMRRHILTYESQLAEAIFHLINICGLKSVKRAIFTRFLIDRASYQLVDFLQERQIRLKYHTRSFE